MLAKQHPWISKLPALLLAIWMATACQDDSLSHTAAESSVGRIPVQTRANPADPSNAQVQLPVTEAARQSVAASSSTLRPGAYTTRPVLVRIPKDSAAAQRVFHAVRCFDVQLQERKATVEPASAAVMAQSRPRPYPLAKDRNLPLKDGCFVLGTLAVYDQDVERVVLTCGAHAVASVEFDAEARAIHFDIADAALAAALGTIVLALEPDSAQALLALPCAWTLGRFGRFELGVDHQGTLSGPTEIPNLSPGWWLLSLSASDGELRQQVLHVEGGDRIVANPRRLQGNCTLELIPAYASCVQSTMDLRIARMDGRASPVTPLLWMHGWKTGTERLLFRDLAPGEYSVVCHNACVPPARITLQANEQKSLSFDCQARPSRLELQVGPAAQESSTLIIVDSKSGAIVAHRPLTVDPDGLDRSFSGNQVDLIAGEYEVHEYTGFDHRASQRVLVAERKQALRVFW